MARAMARGSPGEHALGQRRRGVTFSASNCRAMTSRWISLVPSPIVQQLHVAEVLLGGIVLHEAVAAVDLHAFLGGATAISLA